MRVDADLLDRLRVCEAGAAVFRSVLARDGIEATDYGMSVRWLVEARNPGFLLWFFRNVGYPPDGYGWDGASRRFIGRAVRVARLMDEMGFPRDEREIGKAAAAAMASRFMARWEAADRG